ncbi:MAG: hypothetical protein ACI3XQ_09220 [Eubacteriales bacterium]
MVRSQEEIINIRLTTEEKSAMLEHMRNVPQNEKLITQSKKDGE